MHFRILISTLFLSLFSISTFASPAKFLNGLELCATEIDEAANFTDKSKLFKNFISNTEKVIAEKSGKDQLDWIVAVEYLKPIQDAFSEKQKLTEKECNALKYRLRYEGLMGLPEGSKEPPATQLAIRISKSLCQQSYASGSRQ